MANYEFTNQGLVVVALAILIASLVSKTIIIWLQRRKRFVQLAEKLPGSTGLPLIGNALHFACKPEELLDRLLQLIVPYEGVTPTRFWLGPLLVVIVTEPRDIEIILNSRESTLKGSMYRMLEPFMGNGLLSGSDHTWRPHRKLFAPMFSGRTLEGFADIVQKHSKILVQKLKPIAYGTEFDVGPYLTRCTIDAVCEVLLGCREINAQDDPDPDHEFIHSAEKMLKFWLHSDRIFRSSSIYQEHQKCQGMIRSFMTKSITAKRKEVVSPSDCGSGPDDENGKSILEQLIRRMENGENIMTDEELRDELYTIYVASHDTMSLVGSFALLMLGIHKDVQDNLRSELNRVLNDGVENIPPSSLSELKYLEMVIKETMRLFPVAPFLARILKNDLTLNTCVLPKGCEVAMGLYVTHRSPRHWKNPEKFIPERFTPEETALRHPYAYTPFSGGFMGCIGRKFAMDSIKLIIASVVRIYKIDSSVRMEDIKLKSDISVRSVNGFNVSLKPYM